MLTLGAKMTMDFLKTKKSTTDLIQITKNSPAKNN